MTHYMSYKSPSLLITAIELTMPATRTPHTMHPTCRFMASDGWKDATLIIERFMFHLFRNSPPFLSTRSKHPNPEHQHYVSVVLRLSRICDDNIIFRALLLLNRLKERHPKIGGGMFLVVPALMIACRGQDDRGVYPDRARWAKSAQGPDVWELERCEQKLCQLLGEDFEIDSQMLQDFGERVCRDFGKYGKRPQEQWPCHTSDKRPEEPEECLDPATMVRSITCPVCGAPEPRLCLTYKYHPRRRTPPGLTWGFRIRLPVTPRPM